MEFNVLGMQEERSKRQLGNFICPRRYHLRWSVIFFFSVQFLWYKQGNT